MAGRRACIHGLPGLLVLLTAGVSTGDVVTVLPVDDTFITSGTPNGNHGDDPHLDQYGQAGNGTRSLLKFDLSSISDGATVLSAELSLWLNDTYGSEDTFLDWMPNDSWTEETVTWSNYDQSGAVAVAVLPKPQAPPAHLMTWGIVVADWDYAFDLSDNAVTFRTRFDNEGNGYYKSHNYSSKEGLVAPILRIEYVPDPTMLLLFGSAGMYIFVRRTSGRR